jgi:hypothetical protein
VVLRESGDAGALDVVKLLATSVGTKPMPVSDETVTLGFYGNRSPFPKV